jgi:hypothetical protein
MCCEYPLPTFAWVLSSVLFHFVFPAILCANCYGGNKKCIYSFGQAQGKRPHLWPRILEK